MAHWKGGTVPPQIIADNAKRILRRAGWRQDGRGWFKPEWSRHAHYDLAEALYVEVMGDDPELAEPLDSPFATVMLAGGRS